MNDQVERKKVLDGLRKNLSTAIARMQRGRPNQSLLLLGPPCSGKSEQLDILTSDARRLSASLVSLKAQADASFITRLTDQLRAALVTPQNPAADSAEYLGCLEADLTDVMLEVGRIHKSTGNVVVIFADDLDHLNQVELEALIIALHRCSQLSLPLLFVGTGTEQLRIQMTEARAYADRLFSFKIMAPKSETS